MRAWRKGAALCCKPIHLHPPPPRRGPFQQPAARRAPACLNGAVEKHPAVENRVSGARTALLPAAEPAECLCTFENRQKGCGGGGGVFGWVERVGRVGGAIRMPIDLNASSVRDDFLGHNGRRVEK